MSQKAYFQAKKGHFVSNGKLKVKFYSEIICVEDEAKIELLRNSKSVKEIIDENVSQENNKNEGPKTIDQYTMKELKEKARENGATEDEIKEAKTKADMVALIEGLQS